MDQNFLGPKSFLTQIFFDPTLSGLKFSGHGLFLDQILFGPIFLTKTTIKCLKTYCSQLRIHTVNTVSRRYLHSGQQLHERYRLSAIFIAAGSDYLPLIYCYIWIIIRQHMSLNLNTTMTSAVTRSLVPIFQTGCPIKKLPLELWDYSCDNKIQLFSLV